MLTETARVIESLGNRARVETERTEACQQCAASGACQTLGGGKKVEVDVINHLRAKVGDRVELALPESSFLKASAITYAVPLTGLVGGAALGQWTGPTIGLSADTASMILAGAGLVMAFLLVSRLCRRYAEDEKYIPRIVRVLPGPPEGKAGPAATGPQGQEV